MGKMIVLLACLMILTANITSGQVVPRRDEEWPPKDFLEELAPHKITCMQKTGVDEQSIIQFSDGEAHNDPILKCYMNCMFHEYLIVDDNGEFHMDKVKAKLPPSVREVAFRLLDACFNVHTDGETQCDRAHLLHLCWKKTDPYHYFLV